MYSESVLLIAATTGYQTEAFRQAAERLQIPLLLATDRCHVLPDPWGDRAIPVRFEDPHASASLLLHSLERPPRGVVALGDAQARLAAQAAACWELPFHPLEATVAAADKWLARRRFEQAGLLVPRYACIEDHSRSPVGYPCVVKPTDLSASRGVIRVNDDSQFPSAVRRVQAILASPDVRRLHPACRIYAEEYIPGTEFAAEALMTYGSLRLLALFDKPDPLEGPFFEETIYVTPSRAPADIQQAIETTLAQACRALGLWHGPVHAEMRVNDRGVWILEVAARPIGGLCARALRFQPDITLEELLLLHAHDPHSVASLQRQAQASAVMMIPIPKSGVFQSASGEQQARSVPGIIDVVITAKPGQRLLQLPEGHSYLGFLFACADTPQEAESALRRAHSLLSFDIAQDLLLS